MFSELDKIRPLIKMLMLSRKIVYRLARNIEGK